MSTVGDTPELFHKHGQPGASSGVDLARGPVETKRLSIGPGFTTQYNPLESLQVWRQIHISPSRLVTHPKHGSTLDREQVTNAPECLGGSQDKQP